MVASAASVTAIADAELTVSSVENLLKDPNDRSFSHNKKPPPRRGLSDSVDLNRLLIPDQPMAGACRATGVDSAAARSRGKL